jgi:hypothetical protein
VKEIKDTRAKKHPGLSDCFMKLPVMTAKRQKALARIWAALGYEMTEAV